MIADMGRRVSRLHGEGRHAEAESACRDILALDPANPAARYALALLLLSRGAWEEGWACYEARTRLPELNIRKPAPSYPEWRGEPVGSLMVWAEQGLGDQIMFARWIPELVRRGVKVTFVCSPVLARLFSDLGAAISPAEGQISVPRHDAWALVGSLPHLAGEWPPPVPLASEPGGSGLGVMSKGRPAHPNDAERSMPEPFASELLGLGRDLRPEVTGARDMEDTRRIVAGLAAVATVDTSVAHLAASMGKPVFLLTAHRPEWRWGRGEARTPWYPSVEIIRQPAPGDWRGAMDALASRLASFRA